MNPPLCHKFLDLLCPSQMSNPQIECRDSVKRFLIGFFYSISKPFRLALTGDDKIFDNTRSCHTLYLTLSCFLITI